MSTTLDIATPDGTCRSYVFRPAGDGPWPAVIFYMDGPGIRPALFAMADRLASHGYFVLLPDLFYRVGGSDPKGVSAIFTDQEKRRAWMAKYLPSASLANVRRDTSAFLDFLAAQPDVEQPYVGTTGYCMGGGHSLTAAGLHPDRVVAAASYHGGSLATDAPESPHRLAPTMKARVYVAGASQDPLFPDDMKQRLEAALREAGVDHVVETYEGAKHGWVPSDTPTHDPAAAERHFETLISLLDAKLKPARG